MLVGVAIVALVVFPACSRRGAIMPKDGLELLSKFGIDPSLAQVYEETGGKNQTVTWIRCEMHDSEIRKIIANDAIMGNVSESSSSDAVADGHARMFPGGSGFPVDSWIPVGYNLSKGYVGNRKSVAFYSSGGDKKILVITIFR